MIRRTVTREPEWDERQRSLLLAHESNMAEIGPHGVSRADAMNPDNAFKFVSTVVTDYAAETLAADQNAYYDKWDKDPKKPINRAGHLWSVRLKDS